jgi:hypothetical protein
LEAITEIATEVTLADLHIIRAALNSAYHHNLVVDLAEQYRKLQQRPSQSKLTTALHNALTITMAYIQLAETEEGEDQNGQ